MRATRWGLALAAGGALSLLGSAGANAVDPPAEYPVAQARADQWYLEETGVLKAQQVTRGDGVLVCLIDSGVDPRHPGLAGMTFEPGADLSGQGDPQGLAVIDKDYHGTGMAMMIGAQGTDGGPLGVAPGARVMSVSSRGGMGSGAEAVKLCADRGAKVISMSFGGGVTRDVVEYAQARDVVLVAAVGNNFGGEVDYPANIFGVLSVGGVSRDGAPDPMSAVGGYVQFTPGEADIRLDRQGVAVLAPSSTVAGADVDSCQGWLMPRSLNRWAPQCGTSNATAYTAGVVALVRAAHPELNAANVVNRIVTTAKPVPGESAVPSPVSGFGVVDPYAAVKVRVSPMPGNPLGSMYTKSMGRWNAAVTAEKVEPPVGATLPPAPFDAPVTGEPWDTTEGLPGHEWSRMTWLLVGAGVAVLALVGVVVAIVVVMSRRRRPAG